MPRHRYLHRSRVVPLLRTTSRSAEVGRRTHWRPPEGAGAKRATRQGVAAPGHPRRVHEVRASTRASAASHRKNPTSQAHPIQMAAGRRAQSNQQSRHPSLRPTCWASRQSQARALHNPPCERAHPQEQAANHRGTMYHSHHHHMPSPRRGQTQRKHLRATTATAHQKRASTPLVRSCSCFVCSPALSGWELSANRL